jgi:HEAT repeat protein
LEIYCNGYEDEPVRREAAAAIGQIGTNAIPYLLANIHHEIPGWMSKVEWATGRLPEPVSSSWDNIMIKHGHRSQLVQVGFCVLGSNAAPAIPQLISALEYRYARSDCAGGPLRSIGAAAIPPLVETLTNRTLPAERRAGAAWTLGLMGTNASCVVGVLIQCLDDEIEVANMAAASLGVVTVEADADRVVAALTNAIARVRTLNSPFEFRLIAVESLGDLGRKAQRAIPLLVDLSLSDDTMLADEAKLALARIAPEKYLSNRRQMD